MLSCGVTTDKDSILLTVNSPPSTVVYQGGVECLRIEEHNTTVDPHRKDALFVLIRGLHQGNESNGNYWTSIRQNIARTLWPWLQGNLYTALEAPELSLTIDQANADADAILFPPYTRAKYDQRQRATVAANQFGSLMATAADTCLQLWLLPLMFAFHPIVLDRVRDQEQAEKFYNDLTGCIINCYATALTRGLVSQLFLGATRRICHKILPFAMEKHLQNRAEMQQVIDAGEALPPPLIGVVAVASGLKKSHASSAATRRRTPRSDVTSPKQHLNTSSVHTATEDERTVDEDDDVDDDEMLRIVEQQDDDDDPTLMV